ncbi:AraC family transcriptional regulator [Gabonia massiliensis]|jgi:transcriptional regulator|uniref:AraC family transcriptional regulator n=1 Tax=Gabonia massiliensis TaxID=1686296 RepID=UPI0012B5A6F0|nr:AraC family transcriptional regulator [Gabonia massiliensis]
MKELTPEKRLLKIDSRNIEEIINISFNERNGFLLCKSGTIILQMDDNDYELKKNDLYIYPAFSESIIKKYSEDFTALAGIVEYQYSFLQMKSISDDSRGFADIRFCPKVSLQENVVCEIEKLFSHISERKKVHREMSELVISSLEQALFYEVVGAYMAHRPKNTGRRNRMDKIFETFLAELHSNFKEHKDVKFYADSQYITQRHFATQIQSKSGKTPLQWIELFVISEAKHLLSNPYKSIKEIAMTLNFSDLSAFGRYFRRYTGISPSDYRAMVSAKKHSSGS